MTDNDYVPPDQVRMHFPEVSDQLCSVGFWPKADIKHFNFCPHGGFSIPPLGKDALPDIRTAAARR
jgi:hypothetical protein